MFVVKYKIALEAEFENNIITETATMNWITDFP